MKLRKEKYLQSVVVIMASLITASMIELMIFSSGGHQSSYYVGMIIILVFSNGFLPISMRLTALVSGLVLISYFFPLILWDDIINPRIFINNNIFLLTFALGGVGWRYVYQNLLIKKISLEYDLSRDKEKLQEYSVRLEEIVEERTRELQKSETMLKTLFENATDGILIMDRDGIILDANQKACEIHGFDRGALIGVNIELLEREENKFLFRERMERILNGESLLFETQHYRKDGSKVSLEISAKAIQVGENILIQSFHRDITEKKTLQEHLFQSQKMESIGALAGGIAHDFNNILTGILGHVELIRTDSDIPLDEKTTKRLNVIEDASRKAGDMIAKLLGFARRSNYEILPFNLNDVIDDTVKLLERVIDKRIVIRADLDRNIPLIEGDVNQMEQVIVNLIVNARDAIPDKGLISIRTECVEVTKGMHNVPAYIRPGEYVLLSISDTGTGIPDEIIGKIFEPFFTTKERGKGTGLGLSMVYGTIKEHRGYILVKSRINEGSTFDVYIPSSRKIAPAVRKESLVSTRGYETILVVDDDEFVVNFVKESLEMNGYKVIATTNPIIAIDKFRDVYNAISLVITDVVMPLMDGKELIRHIRLIKPAVKILATSGYSKYVADKSDLKADGFLQKPFDSSTLLSTVRRILDTQNIKTIKF